MDAVSTGSGALAGVLPAVGDPVEAGSVIASIVDLEAEELHRTAVALVDENVRALEALRAATEAENAVRAANVARQRRRYETMEQSARDSVEVAREFVEANRLYLAEGLIARVDLEQSQRAFDGAQRELFSILRERDDLEYAEVQRRNEQAAEIAAQEAGLRPRQPHPLSCRARSASSALPAS